MTRSLLAVGGAVLLGGALASGQGVPSPAPSPAPAASPAPTFGAGVELVNVDTVVTDKKGQPIAGLTKDDFTITEDGAAQTIVSFQSIAIPPLTEGPPPRPSRVSTNIVPVSQSGRSFV